MKYSSFSKLVLFVNSLIPLTLLLWDTYRKQVGANPVEFATRTTGMLALIFLTLSIAVTPIRIITGINSLIKLRRMTGLFAFFYGSLHLLTYLIFDRSLKLRTVPGDVLQRPFIAIGMTTLFLMFPLAITSTNAMVKRLGGKKWATLHKLVYLAGVGGVLHYYLLVKSDTRLPLTFGFILAFLLGYRLLIKYAPPPGRDADTPLLRQ